MSTPPDELRDDRSDVEEAPPEARAGDDDSDSDSDSDEYEPL